MTRVSPPPTRIVGLVLTTVVVVAAGMVAWSVLFTAGRDPGQPTQAGADLAFAGVAVDSLGTHHFPGVFSVTDAAVADDGTWFVLDRRAHQVHRIRTDGDKASFGGQGDGPGEFRSPDAIVVHSDTIVVFTNESAHLFGLGGEHVEDRRMQRFRDGTDCLAGTGLVVDAVSIPDAGMVVLLECLGPGGSRVHHAVIEAVDGSVRSLARREGGGGVFDLADAFIAVARHPQGLLFGSAADSCLDIVDFEGRKLDAQCHDGLRGTELPPEVVREIEGMSRPRGPRIRIPDLLPPFVGVSVTGEGRTVYLGLTFDAAGTEMLRLMTIGGAGEAIALPVRPAPILFTDGMSVLTAWEEQEGTRMTFAALVWR